MLIRKVWKVRGNNEQSNWPNKLINTKITKIPNNNYFCMALKQGGT